jgi:hypothetical protein
MGASVAVQAGRCVSEAKSSSASKSSSESGDDSEGKSPSLSVGSESCDPVPFSSASVAGGSGHADDASTFQLDHRPDATVARHASTMEKSQRSTGFPIPASAM